MNLVLLEKRLNVLVNFFEKYPHKEFEISKTEHLDIIDLVITGIKHMPESFDLINVLEHYDINSKQVLAFFQNKKINHPNSIILEYADVSIYLSILKDCYFPTLSNELPTFTILSIATKLRCFDMERMRVDRNSA